MAYIVKGLIAQLTIKVRVTGLILFQLSPLQKSLFLP